MLDANTTYMGIGDPIYDGASKKEAKVGQANSSVQTLNSVKVF
jgi:hypothetical protein